MKRCQAFLALTLLGLSIGPTLRGAQTAAGPDPLFGLTRLHAIELRLPADHWSAMEPAPDPRWGGPGGPGPGPGGEPGPPRDPGTEDQRYPWSTCTFASDGQVLTNVSIRFKGNSSFKMSRQGLKRPFRLDFNREHKGRTWLGAAEIALNNNMNDATQVREAIGYEVCREAGLPAPRTAFARVHLTIEGRQERVDLGLYTLVEPVNERFLKHRSGDSRGLLLKPERLRTVQYLGDDWSDYTEQYQPRGKVLPGDTRRFIDLARLIARADDATFRRELPLRLDLTNFLRYVAVTAWIANYDSFVGNGHNYFLHLPANEGRATFIPWDLNEAFGGHPPAGPRAAQAELSVLRPQTGANRLLDRVLENPEWAAAYRDELRRLTDGPCSPAHLRENLRRAAEAVREAVFAESPEARAAFQRIALGQPGVANAPLPDRPGPERRRGPPPGGFASSENQPFAEWIEQRAANIRGELAGNRTGTTPRLGRPGPFGPGPFGPGPGGPRPEGEPRPGPPRPPR